MKERLPINPDVLRWASTSLSLSLEDVAKRMAKKVEMIKRWESGVTSPMYHQLESLAYEIYSRPVAGFFFLGVPEEETPKTEFRTLPERVTGALAAQIVKLNRKAKTFQLNLNELYAGNKPIETSIIDRFNLSGSSEIINLAKAIRNQLSISIKQKRDRLGRGFHSGNAHASEEPSACDCETNQPGKCQLRARCRRRFRSVLVCFRPRKEGVERNDLRSAGCSTTHTKLHRSGRPREFGFRSCGRLLG